MCMACSHPSRDGHWSEAGASLRTSRRDGQDSLVRMLGRLLAGDDLAVRRWGAGFVLTAASGRSLRVETLDDVWAAARDLTGRSLDPLGPRFLPS